MSNNETSKYKLSVFEGTELQLSLNTGTQGPAGAQGEMGPQGIQGETGPQGIQGEVGPQGIQGETGPQGIQGETGPQGIQGETGPQGIQGETGADGADALWNYTGEYDDGLSYAVGDVVTYSGETFYRKDANGGNVGDIPVDGSLFWDLLAAKGEDGATNALPLAGGTMNTDATITLDITPDGNGFSTYSEVAGWGFGVQQKENGTNTSLLSYIDTTGFYAESSPKYVTVDGSGIPSYGSLDGEIFTKATDWNFKPSYEGDLRLRYSGERWYMDDSNGVEYVLASVGDESYPWQASWPYSISITPSVNQTTHLSSTELTFDNGSKLKKGTTDAGLGGNGGIALKCSVDYELKWEAGRLYTMEQDGFTIRRVDHCRNIAPTAADDSSKGFVVGSLWVLDDGISYQCTNALESSAVWVAHLPLTIGDGLSFNTGTNTILCNSNIARRAGNQTFTGVNTFSGQVELTGQALTNGTSAVTRDLGDVRYGTTYVGVNENNVSSTNNTPIILASVTLPIGRYQIESCISATAASSAGGFLFGLSSSAPIKVTLVESYGNDNAVTLSNSIGSDSTTSIQRSIGTGTSYRRLLTGIIDIITANTVVSIEFCQNTTNAIASTTRKRAYITARKIA